MLEVLYPDLVRFQLSLASMRTQQQHMTSVHAVQRAAFYMDGAQSSLSNLTHDNKCGAAFASWLLSGQGPAVEGIAAHALL